MPQIILKERTAHLACYTFFTRDVDQYKKNVTFTAPSTKNKTLISSYCRPVNIAKFLRTPFLQNSSRSSRLQILFKIGVLKSFANFTGKHLCWSLFLKNLQAEGLQLHKKRLRCLQVFSCKVCEIFKKTFSYRTPPVAAFAPLVAASVFF